MKQEILHTEKKNWYRFALSHKAVNMANYFVKIFGVI